MFAHESQLEVPRVDLVSKCLCKLQDGLKVTSSEAKDALLQYRKFQATLGGLQQQILRPSRSPKGTSVLYIQEKSFKDRTEKIIASKEKQIVKLKQQLKETTLRLSALVGTQTTGASDEKTDLSDPFKPQKLAEDYRGIFNNEWKDAFEELDVALEEAKLAYQFCRDVKEQQLSHLMKREMDLIRIMVKPRYEEPERRKPMVADGVQPRKFEKDETMSLLRKYQRCLARTSLPGIRQIFLTIMTRTPPIEGRLLTEGVKTYILRVVELTWLMTIQDPPMHLEWARFGDILNDAKFKPYHDHGRTVVGTIWPAVLQQKRGRVMSRGIVDLMINPVSVRNCLVSHYAGC